MGNKAIMPALLAVAAMHSLTHAPFSDSGFEGNHRCKNCRKPTFKSDVCDLRCLSQWKAKQKSEAI